MIAWFLATAMVAAAPEASSSAATDAPWHHPLYRSGGGWWKARLPIVVTNTGDRAAAGTPLGLAVGAGPGQLDLAGQPAVALRVCNAAGEEMLFGLSDSNGEPVRSGPIPAGASLTLPVECAARGSAAYFVYFDNPQAEDVWQGERVGSVSSV